MPRQFSLAYLTTPGVDPVEQIRIAARAGYDYVSLRTIPMGAVDRYGAFCEQAAQFGLTLNLEFPIVSELTSMKEALELQDQVGLPI